MLPFILTATLDEATKNKATVLYEKYYGTMVHVARKLLHNHAAADDIAQDAAIKLIKHAEKIFSIADCYQQRAYIVNIVKNLCLDHLRKAKWEKNLFVEDRGTEHTPDQSDPGPLGTIINKMEYEDLVKAIISLPENYKTVAYLYFVGNHSHSEIAAALQISPENSKMRLSRVRTMLKTILAAKISEETAGEEVESNQQPTN